MIQNIVVIGTQWGDEGKGKIVDWLTGDSFCVVRFQGGHNAGHTLVTGEKEYKLNLIPSGILRDGVRCFIGNGVALSIPHLLSEISALECDGFEVQQRLTISPGCPIIFPYHAAIDLAHEMRRVSADRIGTTGRGIGPAYEDKVARRGLHVYDLFSLEVLSAKLEKITNYHNFLLRHYLDARPLDYYAILANAISDAEKIKPMVSDVAVALYAANQAGQSLLFEGAQGTLLDIDHGTYPFVTSSNCVASQASIGTGIGPGMLHYILGVAKAYTTRVGRGPFPSELDIDVKDSSGYQISQSGREFGTVTGRKRRCGWYDAVAIRRAVMVNGLNGLCITKLDVLDGVRNLKICIGYQFKEKILNLLPSDINQIAQCKPIYENIIGWSGNSFGARRWKDLPLGARHYINRLEELSGVPVVIISTGPDRNATIVRDSPFKLFT